MDMLHFVEKHFCGYIVFCQIITKKILAQNSFYLDLISSWYSVLTCLINILTNKFVYANISRFDTSLQMVTREIIFNNVVLTEQTVSDGCKNNDKGKVEKILT